MTVEELQDICAGIKRGEYVPLLDDLLNGRAMIVDTNWLEKHDKQMLDKACEWLQERLQFGCHPCNGSNLVCEFRKVMDS